ncbi:MAG: hypothetical protein JW751_02335 [Polyangiaceae bacterium]|nr:hypothetical protein [Polyangiaceae bacterium]
MRRAKGSRRSIPGRPPLARADPEEAAPDTIAASSIPVASVLLDGRPVGTTPIARAASPGPQVVVFVHPDLGRRNLTVRMSPSQTAVAGVRF